VNPPCPTPNKASYDRLYRALLAADHLAHRFEATPYLCPCGRYHLTAQGGRNDHSREAKRKRRERDAEVS
jgi:hypothetical protein